MVKYQTFVFQNIENTLKDDEVADKMQMIINSLKDKLGKKPDEDYSFYKPVQASIDKIYSDKSIS